MGRRVIQLLTDDLDGSDADDTIRFGVDGVEYEIDLSLAHANEFRAFMRRYTDAGRRMGKMSSGRPKVTIPRQRDTWIDRAVGAPAGTTHSTYDPDAREERARVRSWAKSHGVHVPDRGRIRIDVLNAYAAKDPTMMVDYVTPVGPHSPSSSNGASAGHGANGRSVPVASFVPAGVVEE